MFVDRTGVGSAPAAFVEGRTGVVQPAESDERPGAPEIASGEVRVGCEHAIVLGERACGVSLPERYRREPDTVFEGTGVGDEAALVRNPSAVQIPRVQPNEPEGVPRFGVPAVSTKGLFEPRNGELRLAPPRGAQAPGLGADRIFGGHRGGPVVEIQRFVVTMDELEGVPELEPGDGAFRRQVSRELGGDALGGADVARHGVEPDEQLPLRDGSRVLPDVILKEQDRFTVLPLLRQQGGLLDGRGSRAAGSEHENGGEQDHPEAPRPRAFRPHGPGRLTRGMRREREHSEMADYQSLLVSEEDGVAKIVVNRPDKLNALSRAVLGELLRAVRAVSESKTARVAIVTNAGEKAFVAGADIAEMEKMTAAEAKTFSDLGHAVCAAIEEAPCPFIAAVNGFALGGGCELALACDFIYASEKARFGQPEVNLGVLPGFGGTQRLARRVGPGRARELVYTGDHVMADAALAMGLVNAVVPAAELSERVLAVAKKIAQKGPLAITASKRVLLRGPETDLVSACELEATAFGALFGSEDQKEGMRAFLEKRAAAFKGC